jgi:hypothetical protein
LEIYSLDMSVAESLLEEANESQFVWEPGNQVP